MIIVRNKLGGISIQSMDTQEMGMQVMINGSGSGFSISRFLRDLAGYSRNPEKLIEHTSCGIVAYKPIVSSGLKVAGGGSGISAGITRWRKLVMEVDAGYIGI